MTAQVVVSSREDKLLSALTALEAIVALYADKVNDQTASLYSMVLVAVESLSRAVTESEQ